jgi:hypothetical protein
MKRSFIPFLILFLAACGGNNKPDMEHTNQPIHHFFSAYEQRFNDVLQGKEPDIKGVINSFADYFVESSPAGVICGKNDSSFKEAVPKGYEAYKSMGMQSMTITSLDINKLDELHYMVNVKWQAKAIKKDKRSVTINFEIIYFLRSKDDELKIFAYITGDEQKVLKEYGLID